MEPLRIAFCNHTRNFRPEDNFLRHAVELRRPTRVVDVADNPEVVFYSCFNLPVRHYEAPRSAVKVYFTGENDVPDFNACDYALSSHQLSFGMRHMRLPMYCWHHDVYDELRKGHRAEVATPLQRDFCSVVVSNLSLADPAREGFWHALESYRPVASGGRSLNNIGGPVADKQAFISAYKFNLAMENSLVPGYVTEKIVDAFLAHTVPIYWGDGETAKRDFNPRSFINISDFNSFDEAVKYIAHVDSTPDLYMRYLEADPVEGSPHTKWMEQLAEFLAPAVDGVKQLPGYGFQPVCTDNRRVGDTLRAVRPLAGHMGMVRRLNNVYERLRALKR